MARGVFITFEGGEGAGKSTHIGIVERRLKASDYSILATREPGGTPQAEAIRALLVGGEPARWTPLAEALLMNAARDTHLSTVIRPALAAGAIVLCDRFMDSTRAYQGTAGGVESELISRLERSVVGDTIPDLTIMFDLDARASLLRSKGAAIGDERFERKGIAFHERVRHGFLAIARSEPERCVVVDSAADTATVARAVWQAVERVLPKR